MLQDVCFLFCFYLFIYLSIYGCVGSSFLCKGFLESWQAGATPHRGARASHYRGLSCCGAQAPDAQAQQPWLTGLVAPRHAGSSRTRARTPCPLHWQADSQPVHHQGSPQDVFHRIIYINLNSQCLGAIFKLNHEILKNKNKKY